MPPDPRRWTNLRSLARALDAPAAPARRVPLRPWWSYEEPAGQPPIALTPIELPAAAENDLVPTENPDAG